MIGLYEYVPDGTWFKPNNVTKPVAYMRMEFVEKHDLYDFIERSDKILTEDYILVQITD